MMKLNIEISSKYWSRGDSTEFPVEIEAIIRAVHKRLYDSSSEFDFTDVEYHYTITDND